MHRQRLLHLLDAYSLQNPAELGVAQRIRELALRHEDCFLRSCAPGHVTASAWIVSHDVHRFLLTHHRKLDRWLQLGGHADGDPDVLAVALREAREESGLHEFALPAPGGRAADGQPLPLDLDVHRIPARAGEPAHEHHDVRYLLVAGPDPQLRISEESKALQWFELERLEAVCDDESLLRLGRKALDWLRGG
jgi:8-oxo-dGTP pyrophosphatase MutT (NUDIX family)